MKCIAVGALALLCLAACAREDPLAASARVDPADKITGWPLVAVAPGATPVDAPAMLPGIYPVGSHIKDGGGFGPCDNFPFPLESQPWGTPGAVSLVAFPSEPVAYFKYQGIAVRLINRTAARVVFRACDSRLHMVQEARDTNGQWKPIESLPQTDCVNSFHNVTLKPGQYWQVPARTYRGPWTTKLRFRLDVTGRDAGPGGGGAMRTVIYSNVIDGAIDPAQFLPGPATLEADRGS